MKIVDFYEAGGKPGNFGAVDIDKLLWVSLDGDEVNLGHRSGVVTVIPLRPECSDWVWQCLINDHMTSLGSAAVDLSKVTEIQYFRDGDPKDPIGELEPTI